MGLHRSDRRSFQNLLHGCLGWLGVRGSFFWSSIYQAGNGVVGNQIYSATFTPAQFISDTPTTNRTELVTVDLGGGVLLPASGYDVFITNPTTLALSIYPIGS